ncbi:hypothetical protein ES703_12180 [subsurface metagenome]
MPIKWSALEVAEAMDEVGKLLDQAEPYLAEAQEKVRKATGIAYLPQYLDQRLGRLIYTIEARENIRRAITGIRNCIPEGAVEADRQAGKQRGLGLEIKPCHIKKHDDFWDALHDHLRYGTGPRIAETEEGKQLEMGQV